MLYRVGVGQKVAILVLYDIEWPLRPTTTWRFEMLTFVLLKTWRYIWLEKLAFWNLIPNYCKYVSYVLSSYCLSPWFPRVDEEWWATISNLLSGIKVFFTNVIPLGVGHGKEVVEKMIQKWMHQITYKFSNKFTGGNTPGPRWTGGGVGEGWRGWKGEGKVEGRDRGRKGKGRGSREKKRGGDEGEGLRHGSWGMDTPTRCLPPITTLRPLTLTSQDTRGVENCSLFRKSYKQICAF